MVKLEDRREARLARRAAVACWARAAEKEREPEVRLSRNQKEKDETLIRVNKRLEEVSRPVSGQSLNRDSNTSRSENPAESSRLGAESDTNVANHNQ